VVRIVEMEQPILADWIKERDDPRVVHTKAEALDDMTRIRKS